MVVVVTGGTRGIGRSIAYTYAKNNYDVVITYCNNYDMAVEVVNSIKSLYGVRCIACKCDVSNEEEVINLVNTVVSEFGSIDVLVNNAGICCDTLLLDKTVDNFRKIIDVNLIGTYLCSKYFAKVMLDKKSGSIINVSSTNAIDTYYPESCDYDASKAGVISLTHNLAREFAPYIRVNCICPGWVNTDMNKELSDEQISYENKKILLGRFAESDEISNVIYFLSSEDASYINDSIIKVDGGRNNG